MNKKILKATILLGIIFLLGLFLRFYRLNQNIPPLYADETGHYFYTQITLADGLVRYIFKYIFSATWLFGLSPLGVRSLSAIYGSAIIIAGYYFARVVTKASGSNLYLRVALVNALLLALIPWNYSISRLGHTHIPLIVLLALIHLILYSHAKSWHQKLISLIPFFVGGYFYPTLIIMSPIVLFLPIKELLLENSLKKKYLYTFLVLFTLGISAIMISKYKVFSTAGRGLDLAIWRDVNTPWQIDKYRALSWNSEPSLFSFGLPPEQLANKLVYNRVVANLSVFTRNYLSFFSPDWLFLKGDAILRHSTGQVGAFYPFLIPFMLYGAFVFYSNKALSTKHKALITIWILASPIPAAITKDGAGYLLRAVTMLPFLTYFCALGIVESFNLIRGKWRIPYGVLVALIGLYSAYYFFYGYFHVYPSLSARSYEYGFKELSDFQIANQNASMLVIWDGYYHNNDFRFWQETPFDQYNAFKLREVVVGQSHFNQTFPNLYFVNPKSTKDVLEFLKQNTVNFVVLPDRYFVNYPVELDKVFASPSAVILYPDKTPALKIYSAPR